MAKRKFSFLADEDEKHEQEYQRELAEEQKLSEKEAKLRLDNKGKRGVSMISGNPSPTVGEKVTYTVTQWYEGTPLLERNPLKVTWELFKKRTNGKFTTTNIKKTGISSFTFGEVASQYTYRLEAYLHKPEGGGLIINPQPAKVPKIGKIEFHYVDNKKGDTFSFYDKLRAKAHTTNLSGKELVFTLWEDDKKGSGHDPKNLVVEEKTERVDTNGLAIAEFQLTKALMKKAMKGEADAKELEFYVTVEYYKGKIHDSENVNVKNPLYWTPGVVPPPIGTKLPKEKGQPKAKGSPAEQKPISKKEEKGIITKATDYLADFAESSGIMSKLREMTSSKPEGNSTVGVKAQKKKKQEDNKVCECEARVRAYMRMLRVGEGTGELIKSEKINKQTKKVETIYIPYDFENGYKKLFGGSNFTQSPHNKSMNDHPNIMVYWYTNKKGKKVYSSASGAYQVMGYNWEDKGMIAQRNSHKIKDFSPESQDKYCIILFKYKRPGMLDLIVNGEIKKATELYGSYEWASLPPGRYGQPSENMEKVLEFYDQFYKEELSGKSPLHLKAGFLKEFGYNCCTEENVQTPSINTSCGKSEIDLRNKIKWQTQFDPKWGSRDRQLVACKRTCDDILINNGLKATSPSRIYQTAIENDSHTKLIINNQISKDAIAYLDSELEKGHPVQVGVDHGLGYKINNNLDHSTDHFVVIVGRKCDGDKCYYIFYDVGTIYKEKGANDANRLYLDKEEYSLKGKTVYNGHFYTVTQIRKN
ncbi:MULTISPECIES: glycoside hydrolase family 104 protein [unclassified Chryseobacterium]|uniref:glycoside hydrolase family 24 protein n=1 Tax=unclassified Chryseobacterium TaxID=2593645 RepID=UPI00226A008F|nr:MULTISPECIES: glycoside hydrolase family 104 protein [unclassified Chryseobacterium]